MSSIWSACCSPDVPVDQGGSVSIANRETIELYNQIKCLPASSIIGQSSRVQQTVLISVQKDSPAPSTPTAPSTSTDVQEADFEVDGLKPAFESLAMTALNKAKSLAEITQMFKLSTLAAAHSLPPQLKQTEKQTPQTQKELGSKRIGRHNRWSKPGTRIVATLLKKPSADEECSYSLDSVEATPSSPTLLLEAPPFTHFAPAPPHSTSKQGSKFFPKLQGRARLPDLPSNNISIILSPLDSCKQCKQHLPLESLHRDHEAVVYHAPQFSLLSSSSQSLIQLLSKSNSPPPLQNQLLTPTLG